MAKLRTKVAASVLLCAVPSLVSAETIKIGVVGQFSGMFADLGKKRQPRKRKAGGTKKSPRRKSKVARK